MIFNFEAMCSRGTEIRDVIEADTQDEAIAKIRSMGYFVTKISQESKPIIDSTSKKEIMPKFYHWWIYNLFRWVWNPIFRKNPKLRKTFIILFNRWDENNT